MMISRMTTKGLDTLHVTKIAKWHSPKEHNKAYMVAYIGDDYQMGSDEFEEDKYFLKIPFGKRLDYTKEIRDYVIEESERINEK